LEGFVRTEDYIRERGFERSIDSMAHAQLDHVARHIRRLRAYQAVCGKSDRELLQAISLRNDEAAFVALVRRHGPLVLGVCRQVLGHEHDAEDAFQATFLILAQKSASIRKGEALASWLHGVAHYTAMKAKTSAAKRRVHEARARATTPRDPSSEAACRELQVAINEEIQRLPARYRDPFVLCFLEGQSRAEAARQLGLAEGTVWSRLARARRRLQAQLARRGVALGAVLCAIGLGRPTAAVPAMLVNCTTKAALSFAAGKAMAADLVFPQVADLAKGALQTMSITKPKTTMVGLLLVAFLATGIGAGILTYKTQATEPAAPRAESQTPPQEALALLGQGQKLPTQPALMANTASAQPKGVPLKGHKGAVRAAVFAPDGKAIATAGADGTVRLWDLATGRQTHKLEEPGEVVGVAYSPDGKTLAAGSAGKKGAVTLWDTATGKLTLRHSHKGSWSGMLALVDDGRGRLVIVVGLEHCCVMGFYEEFGVGRSLATGLGGKAAVTVTARTEANLAAYGDGDGAIYLSHPGGKIQRLGAHGKSRVTALAFLQGGKKLAAIDGGRAVRVLDVATGKEVKAFEGKKAIRTMAFAPDGKLAVIARDGGDIQVWNVATGKEEREERRFKALVAVNLVAVNTVAFSPDGKRIATAGEDGTAIVWDLTRDEKPLPRDFKLTEKVLASSWADLGSDDPGKAYTALRMLRADPARSVPFLKEHLRPRGERLDEKKIKQLIADLDSDVFATREKASKELEKLGKSAEDTMREALAAGPSREAKKRLEQLLKLLGEDHPLSAEQQRHVRAVRVLEQAGTPEARKLLETLLKESPGWWVPQEAKEARERLAQREKK
jgi:RNA polymerase sigma factor (sigma-70 family)